MQKCYVKKLNKYIDYKDNRVPKFSYSNFLKCIIDRTKYLNVVKLYFYEMT